MPDPSPSTPAQADAAPEDGFAVMRRDDTVIWFPEATGLSVYAPGGALAVLKGGDDFAVFGADEWKMAMSATAMRRAYDFDEAAIS